MKTRRKEERFLLGGIWALTEIEISTPILKIAGFGDTEISFVVEKNFREAAEEFVLGVKPDKKYVAIFKEKKDRRSLSQNGYYWALNNQLALKTKL